MSGPDVLIAGDGVAGAFAALLLARGGRRVTLIGAGKPVPDRLEALGASGRALLEAEDCLPALTCASRGRPDAIHQFWRGQAKRHPLGAGAPDLVERPSFHRAILSLAAAAGTQRVAARVVSVCREGVRLADRQVLKAPAILDARGRAAFKGREASSSFPPSRAVRFRGEGGKGRPGMALLARANGWLWCAWAEGRVEATLFDTPEGQVTEPLDVPEIGAIGLAPAGRARDARLMALPSPVLAPQVFAIGDAALARDPIAAHGLSHALRSAAHGAAAAETLLQGGSVDAVTAFLKDTHRQHLTGAEAATARAYADQARHSSTFWEARRRALPDSASLPRKIERAGRLRIAAPVTPRAVLTGRTIGLAPAIHLPSSGRSVAHIGPFAAEAIAEAAFPPASAQTIAARLALHGAADAAERAVRALIREGAFVAAP